MPAGSIIGPLLFVIFINDLPDVLTSDCLLYADDLKIFRKIGDINDCLILQKDLDSLDNWCQSNKLELNIGKCAFMCFTNKVNSSNHQYTLCDVILPQVSDIMDLGVRFDSKMKFTNHVNDIVKKAFRNLGFIIRITKSFTDINCIKTLYFSLVRNVLEYASQIWCPYQITYSDKIERVQRKLTRYLGFKTGNSDLEYEERLKLFNILSLNARRVYNDMCVLFKILRNVIDIDLLNCFNFRVNSHNPRSVVTFATSLSRTNIGHFTNPVNRLQRVYCERFNELDIFYLSYTEFKSAVINILRSDQSNQN